MKRMTDMKIRESYVNDTESFIKLNKKMDFVLEGEKVNSLMIEDEPVNEYYFYKMT